MRGAQEARLIAYARFGLWAKAAARIDAHFDQAVVTQWMETADAVPTQMRAHDYSADDIAARRFAILGADVPSSGAWPWRRDWRSGCEHEWPRAPFHAMSYHEKREKPYDVKYPWEVSRLLWLLPLAQEKRWHMIDDVVTHFCADNPLGMGINWFPMETAMRTITLTRIAEMARRDRACDDAVRVRLLRLIARHGFILWRSIEDSDVRGNHYAANIGALAMAGAQLRTVYPEAEKWHRYAARHIPREIVQQFCVDGVNFEKASGYHRLVTEIFTLSFPLIETAARQMEIAQAGSAHVDAAIARLQCARQFISDIAQPDGSGPMVGDCDDAALLSLRARPARDQRDVLDGREQNLHGLKYYAAGGFVIFKRADAYMLADVGEVGMRGRGGHGHNDVSHITVWMGGVPVLVDPGTGSYTGDTVLRNRLRGTAAHNAVMIDGQEMAPFTGPFGISNAATPRNVAVQATDTGLAVSCAHDGYTRMMPPVSVRRDMTFDGDILNVADFATGAGAHESAVTLQFHPDAAFVSAPYKDTDGWRCRIAVRGVVFDIAAQGIADMAAAEGLVSFAYGHWQPASRLVLTGGWRESVKMSWSIRRSV